MSHREQYQQMLKREFEHRSGINPAYSLRAFARDLGIQSPRLSLILRGRQGLSFSKAQEMCQRLTWSEEEKNHFCDLVVAGCARSQKERRQAEKRILERMNKLARFRTLADDEFRIISDWYYYSYIQLTRTKDFRPDIDWIAARLDIHRETAMVVVQCLIRLELIDEKTLVTTGKPVTTADGVPSHAIRKFNKQMLTKALESIDSQTIHERHISTITVAVPKSLLDAAYERINKFHNEFDEFLCHGSKKLELDEVYCFASQFFRVSSPFPGGKDSDETTD